MLLSKRGSLIFLLFSLLALPSLLHAQFFPVQASTQLLPPYSVYLSDYASDGSDKLRVILVQGDFSQASYRLRLVMSIELNGRIIMRTSNTFTPGPISLSPGVPTVISGGELAPYLDSHNLDFVGYSREQYERTRALPEGGYRIIFTAYDYARQDVQVSNVASTFYYLSKNEPPLINFPACGSQVPLNNPQQIIFSWLPRNTASPLSAAETEYEFSLYEVRPATRNPNDVVLTTPPVYQVITGNTQLLLGPAEPMLIKDLNYVWRVRAIDRNGRDAFRNNGYSEVCTFSYGGLDPSIILTALNDVKATGETERRGNVTWTTVPVYDGYRIQYKKRGVGHEWFKEDTDKGELKIFSLEPSIEYEVRVQGKRQDFFGPYSPVVTFITKPKVEAQCGDAPATTAKNLDHPLSAANIGLTIDARGLDLELTEITALADKGWYKGGGVCKIPYLGMAAFHVTFNKVFINEDREVVSGRIDIVTKGVNGMAEFQIREQQRKEREKKQRENREQWAGTIFYEKIIMYDNVDIEEVTIPNENFVNIIDKAGNVTPNASIATRLDQTPEKAIIIQDKNGDQWVAQKDPATGKNKVTKVEAGGLSPGGSVIINDDADAVLKMVFKELREHYTDEKLTALQRDLVAKEEALDKVISERNKTMGIGNSTTPAIQEEDLLIFDLVATETNEQNYAASPASLFKQAELNYNIGVVASAISKEELKNLVAETLFVQQKPVLNFIADQRKVNVNNATIASAVKEGLLNLIQEAIIKNLIFKK